MKVLNKEEQLSLLAMTIADLRHAINVRDAVTQGDKEYITELESDKAVNRKQIDSLYDRLEKASKERSAALEENETLKAENARISSELNSQRTFPDLCSKVAKLESENARLQLGNRTIYNANSSLEKGIKSLQEILSNRTTVVNEFTEDLLHILKGPHVSAAIKRRIRQLANKLRNSF